MRKPWNIVNIPVYSLSTSSNQCTNMNICTYVTGISKNPRLFAIAIEEGSKTFLNLQDSNYAVLQLLHKQHTKQVRLLGKKSGHQINKENYLSKHNLLTDWNNFKVLKHACAWLLLEKLQSNKTGDHSLFQFKLLKSKTLKDKNILMFQDLVNAKIIL